MIKKRIDIGKNKKGFTLIEMIVMLAMIGILATIMVPSVLGFIDKASAARNNALAVSIAKSAEAVGIDLRARNRPAAQTSMSAVDSDRDGKMSFTGTSEYEAEMNKFIEGEKFDKGSKLIILTTASNVLHRVVYIKDTAVLAAPINEYNVTASKNIGVYPDYEWINRR